jgi:hypothetical protein
MKKVFLVGILFIFISVNTKSQSLNPTDWIGTGVVGSHPISVDDFKGGYTFAYPNSGAPNAGAFMSFGGFFNQYDCQLSASYGSSTMAFRTRNGDANVWNPWHTIWNSGNLNHPSIDFNCKKLDASGDITLGNNLSYSLIKGRYAGAAIKMGTNSDTFDRNLHLGFVDNNTVFTPALSIINQTGNVGIGTTTPPEEKLEVSGNIKTGGTQINSYLKIKTLNQEWWTGVGLVSGDGRFVIHDMTANKQRFTIGKDGNVGIGNFAPANLLSVKGTATNVEVGQYSATVNSVTTNYGAIGFNSTAALSNTNYALSGTTTITNINAGTTTTGATLNLNIANTAKVVVTNGSTTVKNNLTVTGAVNVGSSTVNSNNTKLFLNNSATGAVGNTGNKWAISSGANMVNEGTFSIYNWTAQGTASTPLSYFSITSDGKVGIGNNYPASKLDVTGDLTLGNNLSYSLIKGRCAGAAIQLGTNSNTWDRNLHLGFVGNDVNNSVFTPALSIIHETGNVGIGKSNPGYKLDIQGTGANIGIHLTKTDGVPASWYLHSGRNDGDFSIGDDTEYRFRIAKNGNIGIGTGLNAPQVKFHVHENTPLGTNAGDYVALTRTQSNVAGNILMINDFVMREPSAAANNNNWYSASYIRGISVDASFLNAKTDLRSWIKQNPSTETIEFGSSGKTYMSIGREPLLNLDALLKVNGIIQAKEIRVDLNGLADYVFKPTYKLMPLHEVEQYVNKNSHLPEIPSASEVEKNGMNMGEMQNKMLQKIEELTLYVIAQQKEINALKQQASNK